MQYISRNGAQFRFQNIELKGRLTACFETSYYPDFVVPHPNPFARNVAYSLVIYPYDPAEEGQPIVPGEIHLNYFVIIALLDDCFPKRTLVDESLDVDRQMDALIPNAENRIRRAMEHALRYYSRDSLWRRLIAPVSSASQPISHLTVDDFLVLATRYNSVALSMYDSDVESFWKLPLRWTGLLDFLTTHYRELAREFREERGPVIIRHLILINPQNSDFLVHLSVDLHQNAIKADAVSRELYETNRGDSLEASVNMAELEFISSVVRAVSLYLWKSATGV